MLTLKEIMVAKLESELKVEQARYKGYIIENNKYLGTPKELAWVITQSIEAMNELSEQLKHWNNQ